MSLESYKNKIRKSLCGKEFCDNNYMNCEGKQKSRCSKIRDSFIQKLNEQQVKYITTNIEQNIYLEACPGSGKTEVLSIKCAFEKDRWSYMNRGFAVLTFTNSAETEIRTRLEEYLGEKLNYPHYIGTFTSWIHSYLAHPFLHTIMQYNKNQDKSLKLIDSNINSDFLKLFSTKYKYETLNYIKANEYYIDLKSKTFIYCGGRIREGESLLNDLLKNNNNGGYRTNDLWRTKKKFWSNGFVNYEDVEILTYNFLKNNRLVAKYISNRFPLILIDECQDLSYVQLKILEILKNNGSVIHLIGDLNQSIYDFRKINPNDTLKFIQDNYFEKITLNINYRSCQEIVDISNYIVNYENTIIGSKEKKMTKPLKLILYDRGKEHEAILKFEEIIMANNLNIKKSGIIVRNNNLRAKLLGLKSGANSYNIIEELAIIVYLLNNSNNFEDYQKNFLRTCKLFQNIYFSSSEHLNINSFYKPQEIEMFEWKKTIGAIINCILTKKSLLDFTVNWSLWKEKIKKVLEDDISKLDLLQNRKMKLKSIRGGNKNKVVNETIFLEHGKQINCNIETIHGCKGMCLEAVLFLSSSQASKDQNSGAFWRQWFDRGDIQEKNRLAYVAFSRAEYLLALGIPNNTALKSEDISFFAELGFEIIH